jgi:ParB family chromosome partitioning protein
MIKTAPNRRTQPSAHQPPRAPNVEVQRDFDHLDQESVPITVAIDIAKTEGADAQRELLKAYESQQLNGTSLRVVKRLIETRRLFGKTRGVGSRGMIKKAPSVDAFVLAYRKEAERQKALIQKANLAETKLLFVVTALGKLLSNENFTNLLRAENLATMPEYLAGQIKTASQ